MMDTMERRLLSDAAFACVGLEGWVLISNRRLRMSWRIRKELTAFGSSIYIQRRFFDRENARSLNISLLGLGPFATQ